MQSLTVSPYFSPLVITNPHKPGGATDKKVVTEDIKELKNLLSGIRKEDMFVFGTFLGIPDSRLKNIEKNYSENHQRYLIEVSFNPFVYLLVTLRHKRVSFSISVVYTHLHHFR